MISGADLVGKTTFAKECVDLLQAVGFSHMLHHLSRPPSSWDYYENYLERMSMNSVWDRFHLDSLPYRECDSHPSTMTRLKYSLVEAAFHQHCGFQVVLYASDYEINVRHASRGDPMYPLDHILRVNREFIKVCIPPYACRGVWYRPRVDVCGCVTNALEKRGGEMFQKITPGQVVGMYAERLREFTEL